MGFGRLFVAGFLAGATGVVRRDPFAMLPFCGYHMGSYFNHWLQFGRTIPNPPRIFSVNWFRTDKDGKFLWPGFGENMRVLKWIVERIEHKAAGVDTPIGVVPTADALDIDGLDVATADVAEALAVNVDEWKKEIPLIEEWFDFVGEKLPTGIQDEFDALKQRLNS